MKTSRFITILVLCSGHLLAQRTSVTVIDSQSGLPVVGLSVRVMNSNLATITDNDGRFRLEDLPPAAHLLLTAVGYKDTEHFTVDTTSLIRMDRAVIYLENNVTITAKRFETKQFDISEAVSLVDSKELHETIPRSAPEALIGSTGVWVQKTNHGGGSPVIRGLVGNQILLMIDGIRLNNATYRYGPNQYLSTIDPGLIERIEVIRGNGSVLYGSDALGGVVHIMSRTPYFKNESSHFQGLANARWMSGGMEKSARGELQWNDKKFALLGGFSSRDFGHIVAGGFLGKLDPSGYNEFSSDSKLLLKTGRRGVLTAVWQYHQQNSVPRYDQVHQADYSYYNFDPQSRQLGYLRWEATSESRFLNSLRVTTAFNRTGEVLRTQKNGSVEQKTQKDIVETFIVTAEAYSTVNNYWRIQSGVEWYYDKVHSWGRVTNVTTGEGTTVRGSYADGATSGSVAMFSTHSFDINKLSISAGGRFNAVSLSLHDATFGDQTIVPNALVGNLGLAYKIHDSYRLFIFSSTGFRAPNVDDVSKFGAVESTLFEIPSADLSPERSRSIEAGIKMKLRNFAGSLTGYHAALSELIERVPASWQGMDTIENRRVYRKQNVSRSELYGLEAEAEASLFSHLSVYGNLAYTYGQSISKNEPLRRIPPLFGKAGIRFQHASGFYAKAEWMTAGAQDRLAAGDKSDARISVRLVKGVMPGWDIFSMYTGYRYRFASISACLSNLFDKPYRVYASGVDSYGRNIRISLTARL